MKRIDTQLYEQTKRNSIKASKVISQRIRKRYYKTFGTGFSELSLKVLSKQRNLFSFTLKIVNMGSVFSLTLTFAWDSNPTRSKPVLPSKRPNLTWPKTKNKHTNIKIRKGGLCARLGTSRQPYSQGKGNDILTNNSIGKFPHIPLLIHPSSVTLKKQDIPPTLLPKVSWFFVELTE